MNNEEDEYKLLMTLSKYRTFLNTVKITQLMIAQLIQIPSHRIKNALDRLEKQGYIICSPQKRIKRPHEPIQEYAKSGIKPSKIYEFRITQAGLNYYNTLKDKKNKLR